MTGSTLELTNLSPAPVYLSPGLAICQLVLIRLTTRCEQPYNGRYQGSVGPVVAREASVAAPD